MRAASLKFQSMLAPKLRPGGGHRAKSLRNSWTLMAMSLGYGVVQLDVTIVNTALASIGASLERRCFRTAVGCQRLYHRFRSVHPDGGGTRRPDRRQAHVHRGVRNFHRCFARVRGPNAAVLIAARGVQGLGAAILVPNSLALLNHAYADEKQRGRAVGIWAAGASLALTAGPLVGGALIALVGWRSIFLVNLPIGLAGLCLSWLYVNETTQRRQREIDLPGQMAAIAALGCLAAAIIEGGALGWSHAFVIAGFVASTILTVLLVLRELRAPQPMLPLSLFTHRLFALTSLIGLLVNIAFYGLIFVFSLYFQRVNGLSPFKTGLAFVPMMGAVLPANLAASRLAEHAPATIAIGAALSAFGCLMLLGIEPGTVYWKTLPQLVIMGVGLGLLVPPLTSALLGSVEKTRSGIAAGVLNATRQTGSVLGVALFGSLVGQAEAFVTGAHEALIISTGLLLVAAMVIWFGAGRSG